MEAEKVEYVHNNKNKKENEAPLRRRIEQIKQKRGKSTCIQTSLESQRAMHEYQLEMVENEKEGNFFRNYCTIFL